MEGLNHCNHHYCHSGRGPELESRERGGPWHPHTRTGHRRAALGRMNHHSHMLEAALPCPEQMLVSLWGGGTNEVRQ